MLCCTQITDDILWIGVNDRKTERFENYIPLKSGVTYNSFLITDEKTCVIDGVEVGSSTEYFEKLNMGLAGKPLDYLVVNHVEPDHSGSVTELLRNFPSVKIVGNIKTLDILKAFDKDFPVDRFITIKEGEILDLGKHKLTFYTMPMVHWPESMVTYDVTEKILFSNDAFGSFGTIDSGVFDDEINFDVYEDEMRRYYVNIIGKFGAQVNAILKKLEKIEIKYICPAHGILWRTGVNKVIEKYRTWANLTPEKEGVIIIYGSMYGHTAEMAEILGRELGNFGIKEVVIYDASKSDHSEIISMVWKYKGVMLGSASHNNVVYPPMQPILSKLENYGLKNRYLSIFGTMLWSGGGVRGIKAFHEKLKGVELIGEPIEIKGKITPEETEKLIMMASQMANKIIADRK